jgi:hypothetical protein
LSVKEQCSYIVDILQKIADRRNIEKWEDKKCCI